MISRKSIGLAAVTAFFTSAFIVCLLLIATPDAYACPYGTVFSAYKGNGMCVFIGQGAARAVQCSIMTNKSCPAETVRMEKKTDRKHVYCCPIRIPKTRSMTCVWRGTAPFCEGKCGRWEDDMGSVRSTERALRSPTPKIRASAGSFGEACLSGSKALCCRYNPR